MAENTSTNVRASVEAVVAESEFVTKINENGSQAKKCGQLTMTDMAANTALEEVASGPVDTMTNAGQAAAVSAENGQDHYQEVNTKDNSDTESCMMETDADQDESATSIPATTGQSKMEFESKTLTLSPEINVNELEQVNQQKSIQVKVDPETEAREIFETFLKRLYGDNLKQVISASYKKRIIAYLQGEMNDYLTFTRDQNCRFRLHVKHGKYVLVDANKVSSELTTTSTSRGADSNIIMDSDMDGQRQSEKHTEKILMRPHYKTKELVPAPSQTEMYDIIKKRHLSVENHETIQDTHKHCQEKYGCIPKAAVKKYVSMCKECQIKKGHQKIAVGHKAPKQTKMREKEKKGQEESNEEEKELARREEEMEKEKGTGEKKWRRRTLEERQKLLKQKQKITKREGAAEEQRRIAEMRKRERELEKERKETEKLKKKAEAEEKKKRAEERKKLKELEAMVKSMQKEKDRMAVGAKTSPVKKGTQGGKVAAKKSTVKRGKKGEGDGEKRSPVKRKASAKETSTQKKMKMNETKTKMKKRISPTALVQYVILPGDVFHAKDLTTNQAVIQACHARTAVLQLFKDDENVIKYTSDFDAMHTEILETEDEEEIEAISDKLKSKNVDHILWMKSATNMVTCIATKPYPKNRVRQHFKNLQQFLTE